MLREYLRGTQRIAKAAWTLCALAAICGGTALKTQAQPAPPNDNLTNAQGIVGLSGTVQGTNLQSTVQSKEPDPVPNVAPSNTIWYSWTAPVTTEMDFNTRGSVDSSGLPLFTMLGVYTQKAAGTLSFTNLTKIAGNVLDASSNLFTSRVDFPATLETTYYIQVGSSVDAFDGESQGKVQLNWAPSLSAGGFGFSSSLYLFGSLDNFVIDGGTNDSIAPSLFGLPNGSANARITVTRGGGAQGRAEVDFIVSAGLYTNIFFTNYLCTNYFTTNYAGDPSLNQVISYTNIYLTNASAINFFENYESGVFVFIPVDSDEMIVQTNYGFGPTNGQGPLTMVEGSPITNVLALTTEGLPNFFTNYPCPGNFPYSNMGEASNSDGSFTVWVTNAYCDLTTNVVVLPSAWDGYDFTSMTNTLTFDDFQMSQDVFIQVYPMNKPHIPWPNSQQEDLPTLGPGDPFILNQEQLNNPFLPIDLNYSFSGLNPYVNLTLTNAVLDPLENPDIVPPTIAQPSALMNTLNFWGMPIILYTNPPTTFDPNFGFLVPYFSEINFERYTYRVQKNCIFADIPVQRTLRGIGAAVASYTVHYTMDSHIPGITVIDDNQFATVAQSDYAVPSNRVNQAAYDFSLPVSPDWMVVDGMLTFPMGSVSEQYIYIPIYQNGAVEFDEDIELQLYQTTGDYTSDLSAPLPTTLGNISTATLTINFNDIATNLIEPGGAVDRNWNVDNQNTSQPPQNDIPGADSYVNAVAIDASGRAVIGGDFNLYNATSINYIARLLTNGFIDTSFNPGRGPDNFVRAVVIDSQGRIIIGGDFTSVNGTPAYHIARLLGTGALDKSFNTGFGFSGGTSGSVYALALDSAGNLLVGGDFTSFNTTNCNHIARILPTGNLDTSFLPSSGIGTTNGTEQPVNSIAIDPSGRVILGGNFTTLNGTNWNYVGRLLSNGALDTTFNPGFGADANVLAVAAQSDNSIVLGGTFHNFNLVSRNSIARLTPSGALDASFDPGTGFDDLVDSIVIQPDGNILAGGQFTSYNGTRRIGMARILFGGGVQTGEGGWLDTSFMDTAYNQFAGFINHYYNTNAYNPNDYPSSNQRNQVYAMGLQADGNIVAGGNFLRVGGGYTRKQVHNRSYVARIIGNATPGPTVQSTPSNEVANVGIGNCPGNIGMTQNPYAVVDTGSYLYVTIDRTNGSLGPLEVTLGTNALPNSSSSATSADYGLKQPVSLYDIVWDLTQAPYDAYGWRKGDGEYGYNNNIQTVGDGGKAALELAIHNDPSAAPIISAGLNFLALTGNNLLALGGVPIPLAPALGQYSATLNIINGNFPAGIIGFSTNNYTVLESAGTVTITLLRTNGDYGQPSVTVQSANGTAVNINDFYWQSAPEGPFSGYTPVTFKVPIKDFSTPQNNKFFYLYITSLTGGATTNSNILPALTTVTIVDDHFQPGHLAFTSPSYSALKGSEATVAVSRSGAALGQISVEVGTTNITAVNGLNYIGYTNTLTWTNGDISTKTVSFQTLEDSTVEGPKTFSAFLFNAQVAGNSNPLTNQQVVASPSNAVVTIIDTDTNGYLNFSSPTYSVFQNGGQAVITVTRRGGTIGTETVDFSTYTLTNLTSANLPYVAATPGLNYGATNGQLTLPPGVSSASFTVPVYQVAETNAADRLVGLRLFSGTPTNIAGLFPETAVLTILDPELHINAAGAVDQTTLNGVGFNAAVNSLSLQPDGSILAAGEFTYFNGFPYNYVARMLPDGYFDTGFLFNMAGADNTIWQVMSDLPQTGQLDGNVMVVGDFDMIDTVASPRIARLQLNGALDTSFNPGSGADGTIFAITNMVVPTAGTNNSTNYIVVGAFQNYNGHLAGGVARVTYSGAFDTTFNVGPGASGSNAVVHAVALTPDNKILVGGDFTAFNNQAHHHLVQLNIDGSLDTNFTAFDGVNSDINSSVRAIAVQADGRILIGGLFTSVDNRSYNYIARLNSDGTLDTNFNVGVGCNNPVQTIVLDDQQRILLGGSFSQASAVTRNGITRLNTDGTIDPSINFGYGANGTVNSIVIQTNFEINVAGIFSTFDNIPENNYVRLYGGANAGDGSIQFAQQTYGVSSTTTNTTNVTVTLQRLGGTFGSPYVTAIFYTSNGTALAGVNYAATTNTVIFPVGETFETISVPILPEVTVAPNLSFNLLLTNPPSNTEEIGPQVEATVTITNSNSGLEFGATGFNQSATVGQVAIPVVRIGNTNTTSSVLVYTGTNGSAVPYVNYLPATNLLTFYPGMVTNYWLIYLSNSPTTYQDTSVDLEMEQATNAIITSPNSATLVINSALTGPGFISFSQTNYIVSEAVSNAVITIIRTNGDYNNVTVDVTTSAGTAVPGVNYSNVTTTVFIPSDTNSATFNIPILQLTNAQPNTTVILTLSNPTGGATLTSPTQAVMTIINDIPAFEFGNSSYFTTEANGSATLSILRVGPTNGTATISYTTYSPPGASETNGYAVPNVDYVPTSGTIVFPPGVMLQTIPVTILQTTNVSSVLTFQVLLQNPSAGTQVGVPGVATVGIIGDVTGFSFATNSYFVGENGSNVIINVSRFPASTGTLTVNFATTTGPADNALPGVDYVATNGMLTFLPGVTNETITIPILNPNVVESNKTFSVVLSQPSSNSYIISPSTTVVTITNVYVGFSFASSAYTVSECATAAVIPVLRTGLTNLTVSVTASTEHGSGYPGTNYFETNQLLTFNPGQTVAYFYVTPINNHVIGPDHTVQLNLSVASSTIAGAAGVQLLTPSTAILTIQECNGAYVVKSGTAFVTGSILPSTGVIYSNDTVTILFGLRDIAGGNAQNLYATLLATNGITNVSGPVNYGTLIQNGPTVSEPFTFTAIGSNGQNIAATFTLKDDANTNLGNVSFGFTIGGLTYSFTNTNTIYLPENATGLTVATNGVAPGFGYPSLIDVTGVAGFITKVTVSLEGFAHSSPEDFDAIVEGPSGFELDPYVACWRTGRGRNC